MKEHIDRMDKAIKEKFEGHEVPVPSHLWNSIESNLPSEKIGGGNFFFKHPFLFSVVLLCTVVAGSYVYTTRDTKSRPAAPAVQATSNPAETNRTSSPHATIAATNNLSSKNSSTQTNISDGIANTRLVETKNTINDKTIASQRKNTTGIIKNRDLSKNNQSQAGTAARTIQTKNISSEKNTYTSVKNRQTIASKPANKNTAENNNAGTVQTALAAENTIEKTNRSNHKINTNSSNSSIYTDNTGNASGALPSDAIKQSEASNEKAFSSNDRIANTSNIEKFPGKNSGEKTRETVSADSIQQFAAVSIQKNHIVDDAIISDAPASVMQLQNTALQHVIKNTDNKNTSGTRQYPDLQATQIPATLYALNSDHTLPKADEIKSLYQTTDLIEKTNPASSSNQALTFGTQSKDSDLLSNKHTIDSSDNKTFSADYLSSDSTIANAKDVSGILPISKERIFLKIDSTLSAQLDTDSVQKPAETMQAKTMDEEKKKKSLFLSRCSFDGYATPALGYLYLSPNNDTEYTRDYTEERNRNADPGLGITTGLRMNYAFTQKIEIGIGLQYSSLHQPSSFKQQRLDSIYNTYQGYIRRDSIFDQNTQQVIYTNTFVVTDTTTITASSVLVKTHTDKFQNISIPIHIAYGYSISNKVSLLARTSVLLNYQTSSITYFNNLDSTIVGHHSNKQISFGGSFSIGCYYQFSRTCSVFAEPIVTYYFSNLFDRQVPFRQKQLMLGLQTGIRLSF